MTRINTISWCCASFACGMTLVCLLDACAKPAEPEPLGARVVCSNGLGIYERVGQIYSSNAHYTFTMGGAKYMVPQAACIVVERGSK